MHYIKFFASISLLVLASTAASAQILVNDGGGASAPNYGDDNSQSAPKANVGEGAARQYFRERKSTGNETSETRSSNSNGARYMALQLGAFVDDKAHRWGAKSEDDVGGVIASVTYRIGEWVNSADFMARVEFNQYDVADEDVRKLSFMPMIQFPDVKSGFPLFFGGGAGLGIFLGQVDSESNLSIDYNIHAGARFMNMFENGGVIIETGLKGHILAFSSGQHDGVYVSVGGAFTF